MQQILCEDLWKWKLCAWFLPHALTAEQQEQRLNHGYDLIEMIKSDSNFSDSISEKTCTRWRCYQHFTKVIIKD